MEENKEKWLERSGDETKRKLEEERQVILSIKGQKAGRGKKAGRKTTSTNNRAGVAEPTIISANNI